jgi:hypothetical protein
MTAPPDTATTTTRLAWPAILDQAAAIVRSYATGVTLRQLFYRLVSALLLPNTITAYKGLSARTAEARRNGDFPDLVDRTRSIHVYATFADVSAALHYPTRVYRRDRTEGQPYSLYLGVEKNGIVAQLEDWFGDLGIPILALGGYSSQAYVDEIRDHVLGQERPAVLIYAGDCDPSGEDIDRDFLARSACFDEVVRIALTAEQVATYNLPPQPGKLTDSRAGAFIARHGALMQVELDALAPDTLRDLYRDAIADFWDTSAYAAALDRERAERARLRTLPRQALEPL